MNRQLPWIWLACLLLIGCTEAEPPVVPVVQAPPELSAEDKAAAEKQDLCPVTDQKLLGRTTPIKVTVKDRTFFVCCKACEENVSISPDHYLAKLDAQSAPSDAAAAKPETPAVEQDAPSAAQ